MGAFCLLVKLYWEGSAPKACAADFFLVQTQPTWYLFDTDPLQTPYFHLKLYLKSLFLYTKLMILMKKALLSELFTLVLQH